MTQELFTQDMPKTPPSKRPTGRPTSGRAAQIADDVVQAALYEFSRRGASFSMDEVAKRAAVSKQAIYRRWSSKLELLVCAIDQSLLKLVAQTEDELRIDAVSALEAFAWKIFNTDATTYRVSIFLQVEALRDEALRAAMLKWREQMHYAVILRLGALADQERLVELDKPLCADILLDILGGASSKLAAMGKLGEEDRRQQFGPLWQAYQRMILDK